MQDTAVGKAKVAELSEEKLESVKKLEQLLSKETGRYVVLIAYELQS